MPWPFGSSGVDKKKHSTSSETPEAQRLWTQSLPTSTSALEAAKQWWPTVLSTVTALALFRLYGNYLRRIPGTAYIKPTFFRRRSLFGKVTSVGDGDNFHMFHMPGGRIAGWGWARRVPSAKGELRNRTVLLIP